MASQMGVPMLGEIPIDPEIVPMGDRGGLDSLMEKTDLDINQAYARILEKIVGKK
jgi:hypothetical protein